MIQKFWRFPWAARRYPMGAFNRVGFIDNPTAEEIYAKV